MVLGRHLQFQRKMPGNADKCYQQHKTKTSNKLQTIYYELLRPRETVN